VTRQDKNDIDLPSLYEEMLLQRAMMGFRPVLYVSSNTDLECSVLMLLDESGAENDGGSTGSAALRSGYYVVTN
jgi:hypothetical protein